MNSVTHEPVPRALVFSLDHRLATITDEQGHFELTVPQLPVNPAQEPEGAAGSMQIAVAFSNYSGMLMAFKPGFLNPQRNPIANHVTSNSKEFTIAMMPEALILGQIVLPPNTGDRIEVDLYKRVIQEGRAHWFSAGTQQSRSGGEFRFFDLEPGAYKLLTREMMDRDPLTFVPGGPMYGYPPAYFPHAVNFATAQEIQLKAGMTFQADLAPVRQRYYAVDIPVTNGPHDGQLEVSVSMQGGKGPGYALGYNYRRQKITGSLPNGNYVTEAFSEGENPASGVMNLEVKGGAVQDPVMTLTPNGSVRVNAKLEFKTNADLDAQSEGAGKVLTDSHSEGQNLVVRLEPVDDFSQEHSSITHPPHGPDDESFIFEHVRPGRYWVRVYPSHGFAAAISAGKIDLLRHPLIVRAGANLAVEVTMRDDGALIIGSIEGLNTVSTSVNDATALGSHISARFDPQQQAHVYCLPLPGSTGQVREALAGFDGKFSISQVPPGAYRVLAFKRPQDKFEYLDPATMQAYEGKGQVVRLEAGQKQELSLQVISDEN